VQAVLYGFQRSTSEAAQKRGMRQRGKMNGHAFGTEASADPRALELGCLRLSQVQSGLGFCTYLLTIQ
jgi:hypothetical protein